MQNSTIIFVIQASTLSIFQKEKNAPHATINMIKAPAEMFHKPSFSVLQLENLGEMDN